MAHVHSREDSELVDQLIKLSAKAPKLVKSTTHDAPADPEIKVRSWKMNEHKYYQVPSPFPTLARGIFTTKRPGPDTGEPMNGIVIRGYDKFFNIGEVPWTTWPAIEKRTSTPYTLSLKSNGCIIFIGALTESKLLITSKHAIGSLKPDPKSHAQAGERWLRKYFEQKGKTEAELAGLLWEKNWTLIAELCDDTFEEHVLPYPPERSGLHLHGINECTKAFKTLPHSTVDAIAAEWGFIQTLHITLNTVPEIREFTKKVEQEGHWQGEPVEGFVVRTHVADPPPASDDHRDRSPYATGSTFFFKIKFDEPYMMYRDWREVTKVLLNAKDGALSEDKVSQNRMKRAETRLYVRWVIGEIKRDRKVFEGYNENHGIIATRERFLEWLASEEGQAALAVARQRKDKPAAVAKVGNTKFGKTIIVPVAIPGCGKTTVAVALSHLFGFAHTQSDDVQAKKAAPVFIKNIQNLLETHDVVIADKNNHLLQHRTALRDATRKLTPTVRLLALNWDTTIHPPAVLHRICTDRITRRGPNHQTLLADADSLSHEAVVWQFIEKAEPLREDEVDGAVWMDVEEGVEAAVRRAVDGVVGVLGVRRPGEGEVREAVMVAERYSANVGKRAEKQKMKENNKKGGEKAKKAKAKAAEPRYFGLLAEVDLRALLEERFAPTMLARQDVSDEDRQFWEVLKSKKRVTARPHVTIVHSATRDSEVELWERCSEIQKTRETFMVDVGNVVWDGRVMALTIDGFEVDGDGGNDGQVGAEFVSQLPGEVRERMHITVGTRKEGIKAVEAKTMVEKWRKSGEEAKGIRSVRLEGITVKGRVKGLFS